MGTRHLCQWCTRRIFRGQLNFNEHKEATWAFCRGLMASCNTPGAAEHAAPTGLSSSAPVLDLEEGTASRETRSREVGDGEQSGESVRRHEEERGSRERWECEITNKGMTQRHPQAAVPAFPVTQTVECCQADPTQGVLTAPGDAPATGGNAARRDSASTQRDQPRAKRSTGFRSLPRPAVGSSGPHHGPGHRET